MGKTSPWAIVAVMCCTVLTSVGQLLWKIGMDAFVLDAWAIMTNTPLLVGCVLYGIGAVVLVISLRYGELSILYPFLALSYVWVPLLSIQYLGESVSAFNWGGVALIILGLASLGRGSR